MFLGNLRALTGFQDCLAVPDAHSPDVTVTEGFSAVSGSQLIGPRSGLISRLSASTRRSGNVEECGVSLVFFRSHGPEDAVPFTGKT
jgi:hypothetical protein